MKSSTLLAFLAVFALGCDSSKQAQVDGLPIVGGAPDSRHPAAGYLVARITTGPHVGELVWPVCGATLVDDRAVVTSASCVEEEWTKSRTIVAVGFGAPESTMTFDVTGTWRDWMSPHYVASRVVDPAAPPITFPEGRYDLAVVSLARPVAGITPMRINRDEIAPNTRATLIGYGRVVGGDWEANDDVANLPDNPTRYPGVRKSAEVEIAIVRNTIDAYPLPDSDDRRSGGLCFGDFGGPLVLPGGALGGIASSFSSEDNDANFFEGKPLCRPDTGGKYVNLRFGENPEFIELRLAAIRAAGR